MKLIAIASALSVKKKLERVMIVVALFLLVPLASICQPPPPPPNVTGDNVDVPFDDNMNMFFLAAGIVFAVFITVRQLRKRGSIQA